jgi:hypothetical protein
LGNPKYVSHPRNETTHATANRVALFSNQTMYTPTNEQAERSGNGEVRDDVEQCRVLALDHQPVRPTFGSIGGLPRQPRVALGDHLAFPRHLPGCFSPVLCGLRAPLSGA